MNEMKAILEALLFASDAPLALDKIVDLFKDQGLVKTDIMAMLTNLREEHEKRQGGFCLQEVAGGYQFRTRSDLSSWVKRLKGIRTAILSPPAMETLAVIAYRQPVVKTEIDVVRGVDVGGVLKGLLDRKLVRIVGRKDVPGKPILYGTTKKFLEVFNLNDISELPTLRELKELQRATINEQ
jgi:segregation and condensation protein B